MRLDKDDYARDLRGIALAQWMLLHEARTHTICAWTRLKSDRVRTLARQMGIAVGADPRRHRGPSPTRVTALLSTMRMRSEAAAAAGLCGTLEVLPHGPIPHARTDFPGIPRGERLMEAFELFRAVVPHSRLSLEQLILVVINLAEGESWAIDHCVRCQATILVDQLRMAPERLCLRCRPSDESSWVELEDSVLSAAEGEPEGLSAQKSLFDEDPCIQDSGHKPNDRLIQREKADTAHRGSDHPHPGNRTGRDRSEEEGTQHEEKRERSQREAHDGLKHTKHRK